MINPKSNPYTPRRDGIDWLLAFGSIVLLFTTLLALLGYGVALSAQVHFGVPHSTLFTSSLDLLDLSSIALNGLFEVGAKALTSLQFYRIIIEQSSWPISIGVACLFALLVLRRPNRPIGHVVWWSQTTISRLAQQIIRVRKDTTLFKWIKVGALSVALPAMIVLVFAAALGIFAVIATVPAYGMAAGEYHLKTWVVGPDRCLPVLGRPERLRLIAAAASAAEARDVAGVKREKAVQCVSVTREDKTYAGRVAFSTSSALILFTPSSGAVRRVPLDGAIVEVMASDAVPPEMTAFYKERGTP